jgi:2-hydroxychromene-2-carboxylate isomerase
MPVLPVIYYDLGSPYAYLSVARGAEVLGRAIVLQPVLVGAIFAHRGWGSWGETERRAENIAEIERRAARYGLPRLRWPEGWPNNTLQAMRLAVWADEQGMGDAFARAAFEAAFVRGEDLSREQVLLDVAAAVGLDVADTAHALGDARIKTALRAATDRAIAEGVGGVPCTRVNGRIFYGDDRLEQAAALLQPIDATSGKTRSATSRQPT